MNFCNAKRFFLKVLDVHNFYFCDLALLVVEDMQVGFVDIGKSVFMCW